MKQNKDKGGLRRLLQAVALVWKSGPRLMLGSSVVMVLQGMLPIIPVYAVKLIVDAVDLGKPFRTILPLVVITGAAILATALLQSVGSYLREAQSQVLSDYMQGRIHEKSLQLDLSFYEGSEFFDKLHRAQQEAPQRPAQVVDTLMNIFRSGISVAGIAGILLITLPWYTVLVLGASALPIALVRLTASGRLFAWRMKRTTAERHVNYLNWLITARPNAKELRLFGLGKLFMERSREWRDRLRKESLALNARRSAGEFVASGIQAVVVAGLLGFFAFRSTRGSGSLGNLVLFFQAIQKGQQVLGELLRGFAQLYETNLFLASVFDFLGLSPTITATRTATRPADSKQGMELEEVSFSYPGSDHKVLDKISLHVRPGELIAIVGDNGAGKTTLIKLLCRFYDPTSGIIRMDGQDYRTLEAGDLRARMAVLFQDSSQYYYSAEQNIWFGDVSKEVNGELVIKSARKAQAHEFVGALPQGYGTVLGRWLEEGAELSGGQWRKIALARTLYRDAPFLVLDEPTTGLDPQSEANFIDSLRELAEGRSMVMVSHKIASAIQADRIYVMRDGRVIEQGSHDELLGLDGYYAGLYRTQLRQIQAESR